jgi:hypothetical protein
VRSIAGTASQLHVRLYGGVAPNAPKQRKIFASTADPFETFTNDLFRPRGALFKRPNANYLPLGGAGLRGFDFDTPLDAVGAANGEWVQRFLDAKGAWGDVKLSTSVFGDAAVARTNRYLQLPDNFLVDAGVGLIASGKLYDRRVHVRLDAPLFVNHSAYAVGRPSTSGSIAPRWTITVGDLWQ